MKLKHKDSVFAPKPDLKYPDPAFKIGDKVNMTSPDLYDCTTATVIEVTKVYAEVEADGSFIHGGLCQMETDIADIVLPVFFDGETLVITYDAFNKRKSKFYGYTYLVDSGKMLSYYSAKNLIHTAKQLTKSEPVQCTMLDTGTEELMREAFYRGRVVSHYNERGIAIFKEPTFEGLLRNPEVQKELQRIIKLYSK